MRGLITSLIILGALAFQARSLLTEAAPTTAPMNQAGEIAELPSTRAASNTTDQAATQPATRPSLPDYTVLRGNPGYWRLLKDRAGIWWFLSPAGNTEFLNTVTTVHPFQLGRDSEGPQFISSDWRNLPTGLSPATDGDLNKWAASTLERVRAVGFKGLGAWCHPVFHQCDVPITRDLNLWTWQPPSSKRLYSPDWLANVRKAAETQILPLRSNPNLVGYYIDNEIEWGDAFSGPRPYFDGLTEQDPNRLKVIDVIKKTWPAVEVLNRDWKTNVSSYVELDKWEQLPELPAATYTKLYDAWLYQLAMDYFRSTTQIIRELDPNHLILGVRFKGYAPTPVVRASKGYTDAQSLNYYVSDASLDLELFRMLNEESGDQPIIISEYSFHALDGRSGNRNTVGFAAQVPDQQARADGYRLFTSRLARVPYVIGADWFQWMDEPPSGRTYDGEDVNFGVVDVDDRPYEMLANAIRETTPKLNPLHAQSPTDEGQGIWRESFASKPSFRVPFLTKPIKLNGELSDWMPQSRLQGIRHAQTVGLDRSKLPPPNIYLGWTYDGLYIGMEVFDNDIQGAPASGWWWTRDCVEWWISTRPVASDQNTYDAYSHQFFFVPIDFPTSDGQSGTVGQWHRPGDVLKDSLVPHPTIKKAVRLLPDRYVVELFIPAGALHGFDPKNQPALAFNIHTRDFQHATEYFWSAPKEVMTQLRPKTWGSLYLEQPGAPAGQALAMPQSGPYIAQ